MSRRWGFGRIARVMRRIPRLVVVLLQTAALVVLPQAYSGPSAPAVPTVNGVSAATELRPATEPGQSSTLLPDGRWLLVGGRAHPAELQLFDPVLNRTDDLPLQLETPRAGQSATLLPDGTVLIFGGISLDGTILNTGELYDPINSVLVSLDDIGLEPRAYHSAAVLTDGRVLLVGGLGADSQALLNGEVYNLTTGDVEMLPGTLDTPRLQALAVTMPTGSVLLSGGTDTNGRALTIPTLFDPVSGTFAPADSASMQDLIDTLGRVTSPAVAYSQPGSSAIDVAVGDPLVLRFNRPLAVTSLNADTVTLIGPNGVTPAKVTPVENGVLLFVTPGQDLLPASNYTLFVSGGRDLVGAPLPFTAIGFTTVALGQRSTPTRSPPALKATSTPSDQSTPSAKPLGAGSNSPGVASAATAVSHAKVASAPAQNSKAAGPAHQIPTPPAKQSVAKVSQEPVPATNRLIDERWIPTDANYHGRWTSGRRGLAQQSVPQNDLLKRALYGNPEILALKSKLTPAKVASGALKDLVPAERLNGPAGLTAVTGQVLKLNGQPLRGVTLSIGASSIRTDANGEFTLANVPAGHEVLVIDGSSAGDKDHQYGRYEYGMTVQAGKTTALPFVIWMSLLDTQDAMKISSPTSGQTVLTNPEIPGLELRIPAGTVIRDAAGKIVTQISMTAIPTDQPPFPLPEFPVPVYFTIQPGGAHLESVGGQVNPGAQLIYPNFTKSPPRTRMTFWNYDASGKGWYIYGQGTVTADGSQVMPDPGVVIYEFSGAMVSLPSNAPTTGPTPGGPCEGDPVDCATGLFVYDSVDLKVPDVIPIEVRRTYRPNDNTSRAFGIGTTLGYDLFNVGTSNATASSGYTYTYQDLILPDGAHVHYPRISQGTSYADAVYQNTSTPGEYFGSFITFAGPSGGDGWTLTLRDGTLYSFPDSDGSNVARQAAANAIIDRNGNQITLTRVSYNLTQITSPNGRHLNLTYDSSNRITQASDDMGRTVSYAYDAQGRLAVFTDAAGNTEHYTYDANNNMLTITDRRGHLSLTNTYDSNNRVSTQTYADGTTSSFAYTLDSTGTIVTQTTFTDRRGVVTQRSFSANSYVTQTIRAVGSAVQQTVSLTRDPNTNLLTSVTDALNRTTNYSFDALGNLTQLTRLAGTGNAVTISAQYNSTFSEPTLITDPNGNVTQFTYDSTGDLLQVTDALNHNSSFTYDSEGRLLTVTDGNSNTTSLAYFGANLRAIVDPLGNRTVFNTDVVGRVVGITNPVGAQASRTYDALDDLTSVTDPNGAQVRVSYDPNGNVLTRTDANSNVTTYTYDAFNRSLSMTDPLGHTESYAYESGGLISQLTDRKAQVRGWTYDGLGRATQLGSGATVSSPTNYTSTVSQTWDAGNRITQIVDSVSGTITRTYDGLNRLTQETTPQGTISYIYDAGGRRTSMTAQGQPTITYTWDAANRLTQIQQAAGSINGNTTQTVAFQYDNANRRTQMMLPNGVTVSYGYDSVNELTSVNYAQANGTAIGNLTYTYDASGARTSVGGSLANMIIPGVSSTSSYDANNRLTLLNGAALAYDANGNTTNDGTNAYTWDARNRLVSLAGPVNASFQYDAMGRRTQKVVGGSTTGYLYDGPNYVQEQSGTGSVTAALMTGGIDELFARATSAGISVPISDALGSVIAETNTAQAVTTSYGYDPYGATTQTGTNTGNSQQYTGRENDGTGLYYYRARYYSAATARFIAEDPIRWASGQANNYAYAWGNPISYTDPLGLRPLTATEKCKLKPYIPQVDLDNADLHDGQVPWYLGKDFAGITRGNDIYFRPGVYDGTTAAGIGILGHELVHVGQYRNGMNWLTYLWSTRNGYMNSPYEKAAFALENTIVNDLTNNPGGGSCECQQ